MPHIVTFHRVQVGWSSLGPSGSCPTRSTEETRDFIQNLMYMPGLEGNQYAKCDGHLERRMHPEELDIIVGLLGSPDERYRTAMVSQIGSA